VDLAALLCLLALGAPAEAPPLLPRAALLGPPARSAPALSPDGLRLAFLGPDARGVIQAWVRTLGREGEEAAAEKVTGTFSAAAAEKVTGTFSGTPVSGLAWAADGAALLLLQASEAGGATHLLQLDLGSRRVRDLTPWRGVTARLLATSPRVPDRVLVELDLRGPEAKDVYRIDLRTGAVELDTPDPGDVERWLADSSLEVRGAQAVGREGGAELRVRGPGQKPWTVMAAAGPEEHLELLELTEDGRGAVLATSLSADTDRVVEKSLLTGSERLLGHSERSDLAAWLGHPTRHQVRALGFEVAGRLAWTATDWRVREDLEALARTSGGDVRVVSIDSADARWVVEVSPVSAPPRYFLWDRRARRAEPLFESRPELADRPLAPRQAITLTARDGTTLPGFLTRPGGATSPAPLVLLVHEDPWRRDAAGFDGPAQLLADRGYAVLQVNFRGSAGAGKRHQLLGARQWGQAVQDDLVDAVAWAVRERVADPARVAVVGSGPAGAAALMGLAFAPGVFACAVDALGPPSVPAWLAATPAPLRPRLLRRLGDPAEAADAERLSRSSLRRGLDEARGALLLVHGAAADPEREALLAGAAARGLRVAAVASPEEARGLARPEDRLHLWGRIEAFLAGCLGGRVE
jgi:dipeptidyl aminopeptidase/acylaminoacyl peptidase